MIKKILLAGLLGLMVHCAQAQMVIDTWTLSTGVDTSLWMDLSGYDTVIITPGNRTAANSGLKSIGFPFTLGETTHTKFSTSINGTVRLGNTVVPSSGYYDQPLGSNRSNSPKIEAFGGRGRFDATCYTRMALLGDNGNRVRVVETRMKSYNCNDSLYISFQVQLFENGGLRIVYGQSDEGAVVGTTQNGVVAALSPEQDIIFIDLLTHEVSRFDGGTGSCTLTNSVWPEQGRWYMLALDSNACPHPAGVTSLNTDPTDIRLQRNSAPADMRVLIPAVGIDTIWPQTVNYLVLGGGFNPSTTYQGSVQSVCGDRTSFRTRAFQFTTGCGPVVRLPWKDVFTNATAACWDNTQSTGTTQQWLWRSGYNYMEGRSSSGQTYNEWLVSPILTLPDDEGIMLRWRYKASQLNGVAPTVDVRVAPCTADGTVDSNQWTTVQTLDTFYSSFVSRKISLDNWSGQRVKVAFVRIGTGGNSTFIDDVELLVEHEPVISLTTPATAFVADTTVMVCNMDSGIVGGAQYIWHSTLLDTTIVTIVPIVTINYHTAGTDTLTVIAVNAYGADTTTATIHVINCLTTIPWTENFEGYSLADYNYCWTIKGWYHLSSGVGYTLLDERGVQTRYEQMMVSNTTVGSYMLSPSITIPATNVEHLKLWVECVAPQLMVRLSTSASTDTADYTDTLLIIQGDNRHMRRYLADLAPYAGETIRIGLFRMSGNAPIVNAVRVDYDTLPILDTIRGLDYTGTYRSTKFTSSLLHGPADNLTYTWYSPLLDTTIVTIDSIVTITYHTPGTDTLRLIATNAFGSDTITKIVHVTDCQPVTTLPWTETFVNGIDCWYLPMGSNWVGHRGELPYMYVHTNGSTASLDSWVVSPAIDIPADTNEQVRVFWKVTQSNNSIAFHYDVLASVSNDYTDLSGYQVVYSDSTLHPSGSLQENYDLLSASLSAYAGQTIHLAFRNRPVQNVASETSLFISSMTVRATHLPMLGDIRVPADIYTDDGPQQVVAILNEGNRTGLTYTWHSTLLDTTIVTIDTIATINYRFPGTDTLSVIATNAYGADTAYAVVRVHQCSTVGLPFVEPFKNDSTLTCWRMWNFNGNAMGWRIEDNWYAGNFNVMIAGTYYEQANAWLVTPEIEIPANTDGVNLKVKVYGASSSSGTTYLTVRVSTTGATDTALFTDTLYHGSFNMAWTRLNESLNAYAGQRIHLAFVHTGTSYYGFGIFLDSMIVDYDYLPQATVTHTNPVVGLATTYRATLNNCVTTGLTYTWHSSLLDTTIVSIGTIATINYTSPGIDTVTLIVSNAFGADTVTTIVEVTDCLILSLPYGEDFESVSPTAWNAVGDLSHCWNSIWTGSTSSSAPHVVTGNDYPFIGTLPDNAVLMLAGSASGYSSDAYIMLPAFVDSLQNLNMVLDYRFESARFGTLSVGYFNDNNVFTAVKTLEPQEGSYARDTVDFRAATMADNARMSVRWSCNSSFYGVAIDNIMVFDAATAALLPRISFEADETVFTYDDVVYSATLVSGDTNGLTYTCSSSLLGTTQQSTIPTFHFLYTSVGYDTIMMTATNAHGSHSVKQIVWVSKCRHVPYFEDFEEATVYATVADGSYIYHLPNCWTSPWFGNHVQCIEVTTEYTPNTTKKLRMIAGVNSMFDTINYAVLPELEYSVDQLSLALDYFDGTVGTLSVGYVVGSQYTPVYNLTSVTTINGRTAMHRDTASLSGITAPAGARLAIGYINSNSLVSWDQVFVDNVEVFLTNQTGLPPAVTLVGPSEVEVFNNATFTATLTAGDTVGLTYTWHSTLLDTTIVTIGTIVTINYSFPGIDTLTLVAANAYGTANATHIVNVVWPVAWQPEVTLSIDTPYTAGLPVTYHATLLQGDTAGLTYTWHSTLLDTTIVTIVTIVTINYSFPGIDTLTLVAANAYGSDTATLVVALEWPPLWLPRVDLIADEAYYTCDTAIYTVTLLHGDTTGLTYTWHSTLLDTTIVTIGTIVTINYSFSGIDTIGVTATNRYGSYYTTSIVEVRDCQVATEFPYVSAPAASDAEFYCWKVWQFDSICANETSFHGRWTRYPDYNHERRPSVMSNEGNYNQGSSQASPLAMDDWLISPLIALPDSATTITLGWNDYCEFTTYHLMLSTTGRTSPAHFTDTLFIESRGYNLTGPWETHTLDLSAYAGQTISIAFHHVGPIAAGERGVVRMDSIWVLCDYTPVVPDTVWRTLTLLVNDTVMGTVSGNGRYADNAYASISATPNSGYHFSHWSDNDTNARRSIKMDADITLTAFFAADTVNAILEIQHSEFKIYPNPTTGIINIVANGNLQQVQLFNVTGQQLLSTDGNSLDISTLSAGLYLLRITTDYGIAVQRVIKE